MTGGMAVVHHQGVTFFDDWTSTPLDIKDLQEKTVKSTQSQLAGYKKLLMSNPFQEIESEKTHCWKIPSRRRGHTVHGEAKLSKERKPCWQT